MNSLPNISIRIKELMQEYEINSEQLSEKIGASASVILRWTKKNTSLRLSNLIKLSDFFCCSIEYLSGRRYFEECYYPKTISAFSLRLKEVLEIKKVSAYRLIKDTNISSASFEKWFKGAEPTLSTLITLADYLNCTIDFLVGRE